MDKGEGKGNKPSSEIKDVAKIQDNAVKAREAEAKGVSSSQPSKLLLFESGPEAGVDRIRFLVRQG